MYPHSLSFVIPAFNEQGSIEAVVSKAYNFLSQNFNDFEIIVVDDGSEDETPDILKSLSLRYKEKLVVLRHLRNRGYGAALRTGLFNAKKDLTFYTDSDNQFDITEIRRFLDYIQDYDMVIGFRKDRKDFFLRKFCAFVYNRLIFLIFGLNVKDIDCSFKLFKKNVLKSLSIDTDEFLVDTELLVKAQRNKLKIKQIGVRHYPRLTGKSSVRFKHIFSTIRDIKILYTKLKSQR